MAEVAAMVLRVSNVVGLVVSSIVLFLHFASFARYGLRANAGDYNIRRILFLCTICVVFELVLMAIAFWGDWRGSDEACRMLGTWLSLSYIFVKQAQFLFLFVRAKIVHTALHLNTRRLVLFRKGMFIVATVGIMVIFYPLQFIYKAGFVNEETGLCFLYSFDPVDVVVFAVGDFFLCGALISLFVIPLNQHATKMFKQNQDQINSSNSSAQAHIHFMAVKNMFASSITIGLSFAGLLFFSIVMITTERSPDTDSLLMLCVIGPIIESYVSLVILHSLVKTWLPFEVAKSDDGKTGSKVLTDVASSPKPYPAGERRIANLTGEEDTNNHSTAE